MRTFSSIIFSIKSERVASSIVLLTLERTSSPASIMYAPKALLRFFIKSVYSTISKSVRRVSALLGKSLIMMGRSLMIVS